MSSSYLVTLVVNIRLMRRISITVVEKPPGKFPSNILSVVGLFVDELTVISPRCELESCSGSGVVCIWPFPLLTS